MVSIRNFSVVVGVFAARAIAACVSYGVDFTNGGKYSIDGSSGKYFSFITVFDGCSQEVVSPFIVAPDDSSYACSDINTTPGGEQVVSTCGIPYSAMGSGQWKIVLQSNQIAVQRVITLTVGSPKTETVTVTPTVSVGVTVSAKASTVFVTNYQTVTQINNQRTVTSNCNTGVQTITSVLPQVTVTRSSMITRTSTRGPITQTYTTTLTSTASCHLPSTTYVYTTSYVYDTPTNSFCIGNACGGSNGSPIIVGGSGGGGIVIGGNGGAGSTIKIGKRRLGHVGPDEPAKPAKREDAEVAAKTVTYTQTTATYTLTRTTTIAATTTTERVFNRATTTVEPEPVTECNGVGRARSTVTVTSRLYGTSTYTDVRYTTSYTTQTVFRGQTVVSTQVNAQSSSACWRKGGDFW